MRVTYEHSLFRCIPNETKLNERYIYIKVSRFGAWLSSTCCECYCANHLMHGCLVSEKC